MQLFFHAIWNLVLMNLPRLLSEAKFEEMLLVVEGVNGKDRSQLIQSGILGQVRLRLSI
jgi:hypothetical protein